MSRERGGFGRPLFSACLANGGSSVPRCSDARASRRWPSSGNAGRRSEFESTRIGRKRAAARPARSGGEEQLGDRAARAAANSRHLRRAPGCGIGFRGRRPPSSASIPGSMIAARSATPCSASARRQPSALRNCAGKSSSPSSARSRARASASAATKLGRIGQRCPAHVGGVAPSPARPPPAAVKEGGISLIAPLWRAPVAERLAARAAAAPAQAAGRADRWDRSRVRGRYWPSPRRRWGGCSPLQTYSRISQPASFL